MKVDYLIVGAGIQGLVLVDRMRALGLNVCCVERAPYVGSAQTLRSQFYIHRGHFYTERELVGQLNNTYWNWQSMVRRLGVRIHSNESYVGFTGDSSPWTNAWDAEGVPYTRTSKKSGVLQDHRMQEVFTFPHMLVDGREFLVKLTHINRHHIRFGDLSNFRHTGRHYRFTLNGEELFARKIIVCAGAGTPAVLDSIEGVEGSVEVQTRVCQVLVMRDHVPDGSVLVPDAQMFIAPQYAPDGSPVLLYTYGTDPVDQEDTRHLDVARVARQLDALRNTLPALSRAGSEGTFYLAQKTESAMLGKGLRPNKAFVERVSDQVLCVLPTKLSLSINAADQVLALEGIECPGPKSEHLAGIPPHYGTLPFAHETRGVLHA